mmetsp:Transcript_30726/g.46567  ORF Transcript_30726/g.46567 Transcript_30726/m.46567 type:complete len:1349 (-) Transcript_30726:1623-5669(-)
MDIEKGQKIEAGDEIGFLLLEDCEVILEHEDLNYETWLNVSFQKETYSEDDRKIGDCNNENYDSGDLVFKQEEVTDDASLLLECCPRFDGTMKDIHYSSTRSAQHGDNNVSTRSDAFLLAGLAFTCQEHGHLQIEAMKVMLHKNQKELPSDGNISEKKILRVDFVITLSLPGLDESKQITQFKNGLPSFTRLAFSLLRSDWEYLDEHCLKRSSLQLHSQPNTKLRRERLFPPRMSLEDLYKRIRFLQSAEYMPPCTEVKDSAIMSLPSEVLRDNLSSFLRARSLYSLRITCRHFYQSLKSVIPGLKLRLYSHQVRSLEWMRTREVREWTEDDILRQQRGLISEDGDCHRAVTGGSTVKLQSRRYPNLMFRLDTNSGRILGELLEDDNTPHLSRKVARGGLLCDDPGLGKTITVMSLILQTAGISSETSCKDDESMANDVCDEEIFETYWKDQVAPFFQQQSLNRLLIQLQRSNLDSSIFSNPVDPIRDQCPDYYDVIKAPMCFRDVMNRISSDEYSNKFSTFESDVRLIFSNARTYNPHGNEINKLACKMLETFASLMRRFKEEQVGKARKSFSNNIARPNSSVALLLARQQRNEYMESLLPSASNLLVVPITLLNHWEEQITRHTDLAYLTNKEPIIFKFKTNDSKTRKEIQDIRLKASVLKEGFPFLFIDLSGNANLPDPDFLAMFSIVLTTTKRFSYEWKNGSFEEEIRSSCGFKSPYAEHGTAVTPFSACSLLKIYFARLIVDEGHTMGRGQQNNAILFASWISANRRWCMSGTPTPQTSARSGMSNLLGLMAFLKHEFFTARQHGDYMWQTLSRSWNEGCLASFFQVRSLLAVLMIRHTKMDIAELPAPQYRRTYLEMSNDEVHTFNTLACAVQSNLLLTSMKGKTSGQQDSLLHKSQARHARRAFENLRLACSGGLRVVPQIDSKAWDETVDLLKEHQLNWVGRKIVLDYMQRAVTEQRSQCMSCGIELSTLLITACGHLVCTECITPGAKSCLICGSHLDVDDFQRLQPGIIYQWYDYYKQEEKLKQESQSSTEPHEVEREEMQNSLAEQVAIQPAQATRRRNRPGDGHVCLYNKAANDGKCTLCHEEHDECVMIAEGSRCPVCYRQSELCPREESKFHYIINKLDKFQTREKINFRVFCPAAESLVNEKIAVPEDRKLKVIIFSQFRKVLNLIGHRLLRRYGAGAVAEFWGSYRQQELAKFKDIDQCFCMLLSRDGSEGLDLSFVTHIFFLEEIWDKSLRDQAVARAWRMGAKGHVEVETLSAKYSIESLMAEVDNKITGASTGMEGRGNAKDLARSKMVDILENLRLIGQRSKRGKEDSEDLDDKDKKRRKVQFVNFSD